MAEESFKDLYDSILSSKGNKYLDRAYYRSFSRYVFEANTKSLLVGIEEPEDALSYWRSTSGENQLMGHFALADVTRRFHNFLAGASTLVDHTRVFVTEFYLGTPINQQFKNRIDREFASNPLTRFVQDLRNYMLHRGLPPLSHQLIVKNDSAEGPGYARAHFILKKNKLLEWKNWKADAVIFINEAEEYISLLDLVKAYSSTINKFHDDFDGILFAHHRADLEYLQALQMQLKKFDQEAET